MCSLLCFLQGIAVFLSSWTLVVISFDRWMAIMFVMSPSMRLTRRRAIYLVLGTWAFSITMALPLFLVAQIKTTEGIKRCDEDWTGVEAIIPGLIPMVILISAMFAFCWLPLLLLINVIVDLWPSVASWKFILYIWWFSHGLAMMHSMVNPIVYFLRNARFREGFCYFSRFLPCVHFQEFKLLSEHARRYGENNSNSSIFFPLLRTKI
ncbi:hypothetical protein NECAME_07288 [Necator americanus]|uniref:G-protein coupled receptors family 1 profile domain-containing protein n=1 Tax=Necator americanus TaxID=51031 RepID=W2TR75_NECAM|nr:hypothetical protein NECAME_07288 [Necator americanus]ETN83631.1 hypothetical protein NECAME_07288 [Necator americanus]